MNIYDTGGFSENQVAVRIAEALFVNLGENKLIFAIVDRSGNLWSNDARKFEQAFADDQVLQNICGRIDDGAEPVIGEINDFAIVSAQLPMGPEQWGYIIILFPDSTPEAVFKNFDFIEAFLAQMSLTAELICENARLSEPRELDLNTHQLPCQMVLN